VRAITLLGRILDGALSVVTVVLLLVMATLVVVAVVMRYIVGAPLVFSYDLSTLLFAWIVFLGLALAERDGAHLAVDLLETALPRVPRLALVLVRQVAVAVLSLGIAWFGWKLLTRAGMVMPTLRISVGWLYAALPVGFALLAAAQLLAVPRLLDRARSL
jgi:TRAP-type C4-dicarboxylate transport system permease small subunit